MDRSERSGETPIQLEKRKQIDAICDRFELAWDGENRPRVEEYLELLPQGDRRPLLAELLASELALRGRQAEACDRAEYADRFPQDSDVVDKVFERLRPAAAGETAATPERFFEIVRAFRARWRSSTSTTAVYGGDRDLPGLASQLARCASQDSAEVDVSLEAQLWLAILHICRKRKSVDVDAVVRDLLEPFPPMRRSVLIDVLLGHDAGEAARAGGVTQRTVTSTLLVAVRLLEQSS